MRIYIMRHGQSVANAEKIIAGQHESPLSEEGLVEAARAGRQAVDFHFDAIVSSPMSRAYHTAQIVADAIGFDHRKIMLVEELRERFLGDIETKHYDETIYGNGNDEIAEGVPNIEQLGHFQKRVQSALKKIQLLPAKTVLIVCHNGTGRMLQTIVADDQLIDFYHQPRMENAVIYPLSIQL